MREGKSRQAIRFCTGRCLAAKAAGPFDIGFFVINGSGGNMNAHEAALMAWQLEPRIAVPMHYGMWPPRATA